MSLELEGAHKSKNRPGQSETKTRHQVLQNLLHKWHKNCLNSQTQSVYSRPRASCTNLGKVHSETISILYSFCSREEFVFNTFKVCLFDFFSQWSTLLGQLALSTRWERDQDDNNYVSDVLGRGGWGAGVLSMWHDALQSHWIVSQPYTSYLLSVPQESQGKRRGAKTISFCSLSGPSYLL